MINSVPSWVIQGTYYENLLFLDKKDIVDGVELLFYLYDKETKELLDREFESILMFKDRFIFTVHMPDAIQEDHAELIEKFLPYSRHFILHPPAQQKAEKFYRLYSDWIQRYSGPGINNKLFLVENTVENRLERFLGIFPDAALCLDTGHCLLENKDPSIVMQERRNSIEEIHFHSVDRAAAASDGKLADHRPVSLNDFWIPDFLETIRHFSGIMNSELFTWNEAEQNLKILKGMQNESKTY